MDVVAAMVRKESSWCLGRRVGWSRFVFGPLGWLKRLGNLGGCRTNTPSEALKKWDPLVMDLSNQSRQVNLCLNGQPEGLGFLVDLVRS